MRTWKLYAHDCEPGRDGSGRYRHIGEKWWVEMHGLPEPVVPVELIEDPEGEYWGWIDNDEPVPHMVQPHEFMLNMCFPAGYKHEEERGAGRHIRLTIKPVLKDDTI